jgi:hypothetical protein
LGAGLIASNAFAQGVAAEAPRGRKPIPHRKATTTVLFKAPKDKFINGVATSPDGLWIIEQKETGGADSSYRYKDGKPLEPASDLHETAWLMDDKGGIKKTVITEGRNNSLWVGCNSAGHNGVVQTSMDSKTVSHRQVPFGPPEDGGGIHGLDFHNGKLWIAALRLRAAVRIDPVTWNTELMLPFPTGFDRFHGCAYDASNDTMLVITGNNSTSYATGTPGIARLDGKTGNLVEVIDFAPNTCDPHGLTFHQGKLISCDAGLHPGWPLWDSPYAGAIFQINIA